MCSVTSEMHDVSEDVTLTGDNVNVVVTVEESATYQYRIVLGDNTDAVFTVDVSGCRYSMLVTYNLFSKYDLWYSF